MEINVEIGEGNSLSWLDEREPRNDMVCRSIFKRQARLKLSSPCEFQSLGGEKGWQQLDAKEGGGNPPWPDFHLPSEHGGGGPNPVCFSLLLVCPVASLLS